MSDTSPVSPLTLTTRLFTENNVWEETKNGFVRPEYPNGWSVQVKLLEPDFGGVYFLLTTANGDRQVIPHRVPNQTYDLVLFINWLTYLVDVLNAEN
jgi:hypothetical protein